MIKSGIILAAGNGSRFGQEKQFIDFKGKPVWEWSYDTAKKVLDEVVVVGIDCPGGKTRSESVAIGLDKIKGQVVVILDAARPLVTEKQIERIAKCGWERKSATFYMPLRDTIYKSGKYYRDGYVALQVPQAFRTDVLREARKKFCDKNVHDDTILIAKAFGIWPKLILGGSNLHKLTYKKDLKILEALCE